MTRPALVIGLGGTGQWVLTFVKKELLETNEGSLPSNVRLLAFDTLPQATAETEKAGGEKEIKVGKVKLEKDIEFIHIGDNVHNLAERTREGKEPHIGSWFQAEYFLANLPPASFNLSAGAGAIRPLGRMGIFHDMQAPLNSELWSRLTTAIQAVRNEVSEQRQLEIIVLTSLAGGTGSGMFLDVANLVRNAAQKVLAGNFILRGFFVLPRAFPKADREMRARAFAAWRELDRFMFNDPRMGRETVVYNYTNAQFHLAKSARLFDGCYLLDPGRPKNPLTSLAPERGIFPSVADIISAILDDTAGERYTEYVTTNLAGGYAANPGKALHSSLGSYTIQVPIYYMEQEASHKLAIYFLDRLLAPEKDNRGKIISLAVNKNPNAPTGGLGTPGSDHALAFLSMSTVSRQGAGSTTPTGLPSEIFNTLNQDANRQPHTQAKLVRDQALSGMVTARGRNALPWLTPFTTLGTDDQARQIEAEIADGVGSTIEQKLPPIEGENPPATYNRIVPRIELFKREYIGTQTATGEFIGGKFRIALQKCTDEHVRRFRQSLELEMLNILMPPNREGQSPNTGTLGYALDFANGLVRYLNNFLEFMAAVKKDRMELQPQNEQQKRVARLRDVAKATMNKKGFLGLGYAAEATGNIVSYKGAEQQLVNIYKSALLHDAIEEAAVKMRDYARLVAQELNNWVVQLALGETASSTRSLYELLEESHDYVESSRGFDELVQRVRHSEGDVTQAISKDELERHLNDLLSRVQWDVKADPDRFSVSLKITDILDSEGQVVSAGGSFTNLSRTARKLNLDALRRVTEKYLDELKRTNVVASVLASSDAVQWDGSKIAGMLNDKGEPLYDYTGTGPRMASCFVRVHYQVGQDDVVSTFTDAQTRLQQLMPSRDVRLFESDDEYKCTLVRSDDLIESRDFTAWQELYQEYIAAITDQHRPLDPRIIHILPAEVNASNYERLLPELGLSHRIFEPKVVMMLEDVQRARLFFLGYIFGLITEGVEGNKVYYQLEQLPGMKEPLWLTAPSIERADLFTLMNNFVNVGRDARSGRAGTVDYTKVEAALNQVMSQAGTPGDLVERMEHEQREGELVSRLMGEAGQTYTRDEALLHGGRAYEHQEYADLADLLRLVLHTETEMLRTRTSAMTPLHTPFRKS